MLTLVIGGRAQGKTEFLREQFGLREFEIAPAAALAGGAGEISGGAGKGETFAASPRALVHLEELVRSRGADEALALLEKWLSAGEKYICCDEVGLGVVPVDFAEREYRDAVGRTLCALAGRAGRMYRVIAGIGQRIK